MNKVEQLFCLSSAKNVWTDSRTANKNHTEADIINFSCDSFAVHAIWKRDDGSFEIILHNSTWSRESQVRGICCTFFEVHELLPQHPIPNIAVLLLGLET